MIKVKFKYKDSEQEYFLPENWSEVRLWQFQEIMLFNEKLKDKLEDPEAQSEIAVNALAVLMDCSDEEILSITKAQFDELSSKITFIRDTTPKGQIPELLTIEGIPDQEFYFDGNVSSMSFGQWIDLDNLFRKGLYENIHQVVACFIRPVKSKKEKYPKWVQRFNPAKYSGLEIIPEEYETDSRKTRAEIFKQKLTMETAFSLVVFFWSFGMEYINSLKDSLPEMITKMETNQTKINQHQENSVKNGAGLFQSEPLDKNSI